MTSIVTIIVILLLQVSGDLGTDAPNTQEALVQCAYDIQSAQAADQKLLDLVK